jgi:hypothetical protein
MDMPNTSPSPAAPGSAEKPLGAEKVEITLCVYPDGTYKLRVDDGQEIPVESLDQALQGIKAFAAQEAGEGDEQAEMGSGPAEASEEEEFASGFKGVRGGY